MFAEGKLWHGMRRFRTRTLRKVNTEALMTATGQNIKRLLAFGHRGPKKSAQAAALRPPDYLQPNLTHRMSRGIIAGKDASTKTLFNTLERIWDSSFAGYWQSSKLLPSSLTVRFSMGKCDDPAGDQGEGGYRREWTIEHSDILDWI